ncbi:hypothetical protein ACFYXM_11805 [Streptomyces sp. NPDC002476]|uniref:hypothetical protein n=1 Tax=Streptomyces sp. NPDC002476 TaxID=3364648 RepID=UPI003679E03A
MAQPIWPVGRFVVVEMIPRAKGVDRLDHVDGEGPVVGLGLPHADLVSRVAVLGTGEEPQLLLASADVEEQQGGADPGGCLLGLSMARMLAKTTPRHAGPARRYASRGCTCFHFAPGALTNPRQRTKFRTLERRRARAAAARA